MKAGGTAGRRDGGQDPSSHSLLGTTRTVRPSAHPPARLSALCQRCGFPVQSRPFGCKNPCGNCGTVYPLGDCSD
jgi:hypothetical protein